MIYYVSPDCALLATLRNLAQNIDKMFKVDKYIINQFLQNHNEKQFIKTSSKENENILSSFKEMAKNIMNAHNLEYDRFP